MNRERSRCCLDDFARDYVLMSCRRHLMRLWLRDPEYAWETPEPLRPRWDNVYGDVVPEEQVFPLEPRLRKTVGS